MLKLKRLKIHKLPRVKPGTELVFNDGINVLLGINGSGKTTLLTLLTYLFSGQLTELTAVEFHIEYELDDGELSCAVSVEHFPSTQQGSDSSARSSTSLHFRSANGYSATAVSDRNGISIKRGNTTEQLFAAGASLALSPSPLGSFASPLKNIFCPTERLDESTHWLQDATDKAALDTIDPYRWTSDLGRSAFERLILRLLHGGSELDVYQFQSSGLPFLDSTVRILNCSSASLQFDLKHKERVDPHDFFRYTFGDFRFRFVKADGTRLTHHELSFGQQRLLAFHFYAAMHPEVIVADELTNGMHHAMIGQCIDLIGERQAFLATQNPLLLDNLPGFTSAEQVQSTFILCSTERENDRERMVWRNMTAEEAKNFFRDYQVGISHVNDILRSWGLW